MGASPWQIFWRITLPALRWGLIYGVSLTFARALGEFGAVLVVGGGVQGRTETATLYIYRALDERQYVNWAGRGSGQRGYCGTIASGIIRPGERVKVLPSGKESRVKRVVTYEGDLPYAYSPQAVTLYLEDDLDISRGDMIVREKNLPAVTRGFEANMVWMVLGN